MGEPLKGKMNIMDFSYQHNDLESAIEWLKGEIEKGDGSRITMCKENIIKRIDGAFPDLIPDSHTKRGKE